MQGSECDWFEVKELGAAAPGCLARLKPIVIVEGVLELIFLNLNCWRVGVANRAGIPRKHNSLPNASCVCFAAESGTLCRRGFEKQILKTWKEFSVHLTSCWIRSGRRKLRGCWFVREENLCLIQNEFWITRSFPCWIYTWNLM